MIFLFEGVILRFHLIFQLSNRQFMCVGERGKNRDHELKYVIMNICLNKPGLIYAIMD